MKKLIENFQKFISEVKELVCPPATQDLELNTNTEMLQYTQSIFSMAL